MSVKPLESIPESLIGVRKPYREYIREDIQYAIDNNIEKFEFEGDYNYKYLASYAREEADRYFRKLFKEAFDRLIEPYREELEIEDIRIYFSSYDLKRVYRNADRQIYYVTSHKDKEQKIHVYMEIHADKIDDLIENYIQCEIKRKREQNV